MGIGENRKHLGDNKRTTPTPEVERPVYTTVNLINKTYIKNACKIVLDSAAMQRVYSASISILRDRLIRKRNTLQRVFIQPETLLFREMNVGRIFPAFLCLFLSWL